MDPKRLITDIKTVDKIFHIADIHVRLYKRKEEYLDVFNNLYEEIKKEKTENSIIVIAGDIVHSKTEMSPELIQLTSELLKNLGTLCPVIITTGNHDCFTPDHEILTENGWIRLDNYIDNNLNVKVATFDEKTEQIIFDFPTGKIKKPFNGELYNLMGKDIDINVTPTHEILFRYHGKNKYYKKYASDISKNTLIPINGIIHDYDDNDNNNIFYKLLGFSFAEGTFVLRSHKKITDIYGGCRVQFHLKNNREINYLSNLLETLNYKFNVCEQKDGSVYIRIYSDLAKKICKFFDAKKDIPDSIFKLSLHEMYSFLIGYLNGDGHKFKKNKNFWTFSSISKSSIDKLYTISRLVGSTSHKSNRIIFGNYENSKQQYECSINNNNKINNTTIQNINKINYNGNVYCLNVPTTNLLIRHNDKICISGNCNLNNSSRLDALSPIINNLNNKNIYYLKENGLYSFANITFSVMSILNSIDDYIKASEIKNDNIKIAIYHGPMNTATTDTGWKFSNEKMSISLFDGFDMVLLGDIHKHQILQKYSNDDIVKPTISYAGSLIQQNHGESLKKHGILIWDVETRNFEHREIKNDYGYVTLNIEDGKLIDDFDYEIPKYPRLRLKIINTTPPELKKCIVDIRQKYNPIEITINRVGNKIEFDGNVDKIDISNIRDIDFQNTLIEDYLLKNFNIKKDEIKEIFEINKKMNSKLPVDDLFKNVMWKPKLFKFSNMFSYGHGNVINFEKMDGIVGLFSKNASGKTSILENLTFCLFDKCTKAYKASHILNNQKNAFSCELLFEISGRDYYIKRTAKKGKLNNVKVDVDFFKILDDGKYESLNGESRRETNAIIRSYIGTYEDFILTSISSQVNNVNFFDRGQTDRKDLLTSFMDLNVFDQLYDIANDEMKEFDTILKKYKNDNFEEEIEKYKNKISKEKNEYKFIEINKNSLKHDRNIIEVKLENEYKKLINIDDEILDINSLNNDKKKLESNISDLSPQIEDIDNKLNKLNSLKSSVDVELNNIDFNDVENKYNKFISLENDLSQLNSKFNDMKIEIKHKLEKTKKLRELEYDPNCSYCMNNIFVKDAIKTKEELSNDKIKAEEIVAEKKDLESKVYKLSHIKEIYEKYQELNNKIDKIKVKKLELESNKNNIINKINDINHKLEQTIEKIEKYYKLENDIKHNNYINNEIVELKSELAEIDKETETIDKKLRDQHSNILLLENKKSDIEMSMTEFKEIENKYELHQYYLQCVHRDSIPYELIAKTIPTIEKEINNILSQIVDFSILLDLDGKNINAVLIYDENKFWPMELSSGMERFISGMAMRSALLKISNLPRTNFIAIDEGFSSLDAENLSNLPMAFEYLKSQFDFIFLISHIDFIRDFVDISLDLKKDGEFSKIEFK